MLNQIMGPGAGNPLQRAFFNPMMPILGMLMSMVTQLLGFFFGRGGDNGIGMSMGSPGFGASSGGTNPLNNFLGGPGSGGGFSALSRPAAGNPFGPPQAATTGGGATTAPGPGSIGPGAKVLEIGDSHSVGTFGHELDAKLRGSGAQVATYASAGATADTFVQGKSTRYGYWEKGADGSERTVGYGKTAATPPLEQLIAKEKPSVLVVNLGANFRGSNPKSQVDKIGQIAKKHGIPVVWVGPPTTAKDMSNRGSLQKFDQEMAQAVAPYGRYISSAAHTPRYAGGDGIHFGGSEGNQLAKQWAAGVYQAIMA